MRVEFHPGASEEFQAVSVRYDSEVPGLGEAPLYQDSRRLDSAITDRATG